jgi:hypothetical protein
MNSNFAKECFEKTTNIIEAKSLILLEKVISNIQKSSNVGSFTYCYFQNDICNVTTVKKLLEDLGFDVQCNFFDNSFETLAKVKICWNKDSTKIADQMYKNTVQKIEDENIRTYQQALTKIEEACQNGEFFVRFGFTYNDFSDHETVKKMIFDSGFDVQEFEDEDDPYDFFIIDWKNPKN